MNPIDAGKEMRRLRASSQYKTLSEVENEGVRRWGWEGRIGRHQVSRLENGLIKTPDGIILGKLSVLYGVPITQLFDIWEFPYKGQSTKQPAYAELASAARVLPRLPELVRLRILAQLQAAIEDATTAELAEAAERNTTLGRAQGKQPVGAR